MISTLPNSQDTLRKRKISTFTKQAKEYLGFYLTKTEYGWRYILILKYPNQAEKTGIECKKDLSKFLKHLKNISYSFPEKTPKKKNYFWVLKYDERGAPFFVLTTNQLIELEVEAFWYKILENQYGFLPKNLNLVQIKELKNPSDCVEMFLANTEIQNSMTIKNPGRFWGCNRMESEINNPVQEPTLTMENKEIQTEKRIYCQNHPWSCETLKTLGTI